MGTALSAKQIAQKAEASVIPKALQVLFEAIAAIAKEYVIKIKVCYALRGSFCINKGGVGNITRRASPTNKSCTTSTRLARFHPLPNKAIPPLLQCNNIHSSIQN